MSGALSGLAAVIKHEVQLCKLQTTVINHANKSMLNDTDSTMCESNKAHLLRLRILGISQQFFAGLVDLMYSTAVFGLLNWKAWSIQGINNPTVLQMVYGHIKATINPLQVQKLSRFLGLRSALKVLSECTSGLATALTEEIETVLDHLVFLRAEHQNKSVRSAADAALSSVFKQARGTHFVILYLNSSFSCNYYLR